MKNKRTYEELSGGQGYGSGKNQNVSDITINISNNVYSFVSGDYENQRVSDVSNVGEPITLVHTSS